MNGPTRWQGKTGLKERRGPIVPKGFLDPAPAQPGRTKPNAGTRDRVPTSMVETATRWPAYTSAIIGLGLVGVGLGIGIDNQDALSTLRTEEARGFCSAGSCDERFQRAHDRAILADGLWISGAVALASSIAFWYLFDVPEAEQ